MHGSLYCREDNNWWVLDHEHKGRHMANSLKKSGSQGSADPPDDPNSGISGDGHDGDDGDDLPGDDTIHPVDPSSSDHDRIVQADGPCEPLVECVGFCVDGVDLKYLVNQFYGSARVWASLSLMGTKGTAKGKAGRKKPAVFYVDQHSDLIIKSQCCKGEKAGSCLLVVILLTLLVVRTIGGQHS